MIDRYPCIDPPYSSQREATIAQYSNQSTDRWLREIWICLEGHWHEGHPDSP